MLKIFYTYKLMEEENLYSGEMFTFENYRLYEKNILC